MEEPTKTHKKQAKRSVLRRFPVLLAALVIGVIMITGSLLYAHKKKDTPPASSGSFDTSKVLPQAVTIPPASSSKEFNADSIKQYDGKEGRKCYVAVDGIVYEIAGKGQWQNGEHQPSSGSAYCGADLSEAIKKAPHGTTKLEELPQVGTYKP